MSNAPWSDMENDLIVADYFAMLADDFAGRPYSKAEHRRALLPLLNGRSEGSIEFKYQNVSAVLKGLGEDWTPGYKPAFNFQIDLPRCGGPASVLVHDGSGSYGWSGRRSGSGWRSRPLYDLRSRGFVAQG